MVRHGQSHRSQRRRPGVPSWPTHLELQARDETESPFDHATMISSGCCDHEKVDLIQQRRFAVAVVDFARTSSASFQCLDLLAPERPMICSTL